MHNPVVSFLRDHLIEFVPKLLASDYDTLKAWHHKAADLIEAQQREIEALRVDAERYRWLRKHGGEHQGPEVFIDGGYWLGTELDAQIDAHLS